MTFSVFLEREVEADENTTLEKPWRSEKSGRSLT